MKPRKLSRLVQKNRISVPRICSPGTSLLADGEICNGFVRGFVASGLITAVNSNSGRRQETLKNALKNGTAMATGTAAANAIDQRNYSAALLSIAIGIIGLNAIDRLLPNPQPKKKEDLNEKEEA